MVNSALGAVFDELLAGKRDTSLARQTGMGASHDLKGHPSELDGFLPPGPLERLQSSRTVNPFLGRQPAAPSVLSHL